MKNFFLIFNLNLPLLSLKPLLFVLSLHILVKRSPSSYLPDTVPGVRGCRRRGRKRFRALQCGRLGWEDAAAEYFWTLISLCSCLNPRGQQTFPCSQSIFTRFCRHIITTCVCTGNPKDFCSLAASQELLGTRQGSGYCFLVKIRALVYMLQFNLFSEIALLTQGRVWGGERKEAQHPESSEAWRTPKVFGF